ncbi:hypothetical protein [Lentilactobacillus kosonis]|uniref:hypothetical protein n=1 Tax=Lentilactobacillus kosonis TaxID=2810561 RepID=UPI001CDCBCE9|nr:hypothetical protein [Lentilactobacillus kosonis]
MKNNISPVIKKVDYTSKAFKELTESIAGDEREFKLLVKFPTVYIVFSKLTRVVMKYMLGKPIILNVEHSNIFMSLGMIGRSCQM